MYFNNLKIHPIVFNSPYLLVYKSIDLIEFVDMDILKNTIITQ